MGLFRSPEVAGIASDALEFAREAATDTHPDEYMGLLRGERADAFDLEGIDPGARIVTDVLVVPGTESNPTQATVDRNLIPNDHTALGSIHSHPNGVLRPSAADRAAFGSGVVHVILGAPYGPTDWRAFDREGEPRDLPVVDVDLPDPESFFDFTQSDIDDELR